MGTNSPPLPTRRNRWNLVRFLSFLIYASLAASTPVGGTSTETAFDQTDTVQADTLKAGDTLRVRIQGVVTASVGTDTLSIKLKIGSAVLVTIPATDVADGDVFIIDLELTVRTAGRQGTMIGSGLAFMGSLAAGAFKAVQVASTALNTTIDQAITATATWSTANANSCRLDQFLIELKKLQ